MHSHFSVTNQKSDRENRLVLSLDLNVEKVRDDDTSGGRLFHVLAALSGFHFVVVSGNLRPSFGVFGPLLSYCCCSC